jgi:hypothetical protein
MEIDTTKAFLLLADNEDGTVTLSMSAPEHNISSTVVMEQSFDNIMDTVFSLGMEVMEKPEAQHLRDSSFTSIPDSLEELE